MDLGLKDAAVCVQGGTKGMGRAAAECFAADGARVVVLARDQAGIDETVARLTELGSPDAWGVRIQDFGALRTFLHAEDARRGASARPMVRHGES